MTNKGDVIERIVRTKIGISELSRILNVSRTSIYNWFERDHLNFETICKIGNAIDHDFANEFPEEFAKAHRYISEKAASEKAVKQLRDENSIHYWMNKYIALLEKYNELLTNMNIPGSKVHFKTTNVIETNTFNTETTSHLDEHLYFEKTGSPSLW